MVRKLEDPPDGFLSYILSVSMLQVDLDAFRGKKQNALILYSL